MLRIQDLTLKRGGRTILRKINLTIKAGEIYGILGPNGAGKSSPAYAIMGCDVVNQTKELNIIRLSSGEESVKKDLIVKEVPFTILVNGQEIVTLLCSPDKLEYLAVGFLSSEGLIKSNTQIKSINIGKDGHYANVELDGDFQVPQDFFQRRLISSGCGKGSSFYNSRDALGCEPINSDIRISYKELTPSSSPLPSGERIKVRGKRKFLYYQVIGLMRQFQEKSSLFKKTGGVHSAALSNLKEIEIFAEDIGRHNAIDKIFGECLLKGISTEDKVILTSGRISSEILIKVAKRKVPIIISRAAPTDLAVSLAEKMRVTLIGFVRGKRMNIYT